MKPIPRWAGMLALALGAGLTAAPAAAATAQETPHDLAALLAEAERKNPELLAARKAAEAAAARVPQAGALPDPVLGFRAMWLPLPDLELGAIDMTMLSVTLSEEFPFPGKLGLREGAARFASEAADREVERVRQKVVTEVKQAYYELYYVEQSLEITRRNRTLLGDFARLTARQYGVGRGTQPDVLKAQVEQTRLDEQLVELHQQRAETAARLNALLNRPTDAPLPSPEIPKPILQAAAPAKGQQPTFASASAGSASAIPSVQELQRLAWEHNPMIQAHVRRIAAQQKLLAFAEKAKLPDFHVFLEYAQRSNRSNLVSAMVAIPLPVFAGRKQNQMVRQEHATLLDLEAQLQNMINEINAEIAALAADLERARRQLVLLTQGIVPQAGVTLTSATAAYRVGSVDFLTLLDAQVTLFRYELDYHRLLSDFAKDLAALERAVGKEILQ